MPKRRSKEREEEEEGRAAAKTRRPRTIVEPTIEPGNVEEHRAMGDLWKAAFLVGTEWDQMDTIYKINWDFSNLEDSFEEGGALYGKNVYLFGCTESPSIDCTGPMIPAVVAVISPFPPSNKIGITSIQKGGEKVVPMKEMKMDWVPYIPYNKRHLRLEQLQIRIHTLKCTQRRATLKQLDKEQIMQYNYCIPYMYHPLKEDEIEDKTEDKTEDETVVQIMYPTVPPVECEFVCGFDSIKDFTAELVEAKQLTDDKVKDFKNFLKHRVKEEIKKQREEKEKQREARKKEIEEMSPETKAAFENMRFYKFYPAQATKKAPKINRYYGNAHEVL